MEQNKRHQQFREHQKRKEEEKKHDVPTSFSSIFSHFFKKPTSHSWIGYWNSLHKRATTNLFFSTNSPLSYPPSPIIVTMISGVKL